MLKDKYELNNFSIEPNYGSKWTYDSPKDDDFIMLGDTNADHNLSFDLIQAKFIRDTLNEIITYYENIPSVGDIVEVVSGMFKGYFGKIYYIDTCDLQRPLQIKLADTSEFNDCTCFVGFDDIKKVNN